MAGDEQNGAGEQRRQKGAVLAFQKILERNRAGGDGQNQQAGEFCRAEDEDQKGQGEHVEGQHGVPGGKPAEGGGEEQVVGRIAPHMHVERFGGGEESAVEKALVGDGVEHRADMAVQRQKTAGPEIQPVAQGLAGETVALAPEDGIAFPERGDDAKDGEEGEAETA